MIRAAALILVVALTAPAAANPRRCADLAPRAFARLPAAAQAKIPGGADWELTNVRWTYIAIELELERAPHLARDIVRVCPGVVTVHDTVSIDPRNFRSQVTLHVRSFAAISVLAQLPAVSRIDLIDTSIVHKHPMPMPSTPAEALRMRL